jgi:hypothetical protein
MSDDEETTKIIKNIKEIFLKNKNNSRELSKLIDKYFIPQELEKKQNAEVTTPFNLRQEMLDKMPESFWQSKQKVFEPCCGKGGFLIDIIDRFMNGLKDKILDEKKRYKTIVEKCLYWADINATNIFICKMLLDPDNEYKLNYSLGDTLKININDMWNLDGFDAVIGNPPYNKNLYKKFTEYCLDNTDMLLFVIPSTFTIGVSHIKFIELLKKNGIKIINYLDKQNWNVKIDIDTLYFLSIKNYDKHIYINNVKINREDKILNITNIVHYNLLLKLNKYNKYDLQKGKNITLNYTNKIETDNIKFEKSKIYKYKLLSRLNGGRGDEIYYTDKVKQESIDGAKIIFPRETASYNSINNLKNIDKDIVYSKITDENIYLSTGLVFIKCDNLDEADVVKWYLMRSNIVRYLFITENKYSELTKGFINLIPQIDYKKLDKTNKKLYKFFNLTKDEINLIEDKLFK